MKGVNRNATNLLPLWIVRAMVLSLVAHITHGEEGTDEDENLQRNLKTCLVRSKRTTRAMTRSTIAAMRPPERSAGASLAAIGSVLVVMGAVVEVKNVLVGLVVKG